MAHRKKIRSMFVQCRSVSRVLDISHPIYAKYTSKGYKPKSNFIAGFWYYPVGIETIGNTIYVMIGSETTFCFIPFTDLTFRYNTDITSESIPDNIVMEYLNGFEKIGTTVKILNPDNYGLRISSDNELIGTIERINYDYGVRTNTGMIWFVHYHDVEPVEGKFLFKTFNVYDLLEVLKADKPAEHILYDIEDYLTN